MEQPKTQTTILTGSSKVSTEVDPEPSSNTEGTVSKTKELIEFMKRLALAVKEY